MKSSIFTNENNEVIKVLGLDLGTTNSVVTAKITEGVPKVLKSKSGLTTPSCVMFNSDGTYQIGTPAYAERHLPNVVYSFKKYMGTDKKLYKNYTPRDISSMFVKRLIEEVKELNPEFSNYNAIQVSVPAYFDLNQIEDTKLAIEQAGFTVVGVNDEPTAAALLYQQIKRIKENILVFDLGGGTFDSVLMKNVPGIPHDSREFYAALDVEVPASESVLEILDISGDNQLGGDDIDKVAADLFVKHYNMNLTPEEYQKVILTAERVKKLGSNVCPDFTTNVMQFKFIEEATKEILSRCYKIMDAMLKRANVSKVNCVLCGGSTKSSIIRNELSKRFDLSTDIDPDLAVGVGNSIKYDLTVKDSGLSIISRLAKGVGVLSGGRVKYLADKGTIIPLRSEFVARNAEPFGDFVNIELYQGEKFAGQHVHISTLQLKDIKGHDENGYVEIVIGLTITSDGAISVEVTSGDAKVKSNLILTDSNDPEPIDENIHEDAKLYHKFKSSAEHYQDAELNVLINTYKVTGSRDIAKQIMQRLSVLAG